MVKYGSNRFIQVNIYDRTLHDLKKEGIALISVLNGIGCSKVSITEGFFYNDEESSDSECIIAEQPPLSSNLSSARHCSTKVAPEMKLPQASTTDRTECNSDFEKNTKNTQNIRDVKIVLEQLLEKTANEIVEQDYPLSTTVTTIDFPRCSTPISSQLDVHRKFTLNLPQKLSQILIDDEEEVLNEPESSENVISKLAILVDASFEKHTNLGIDSKHTPTNRKIRRHASASYSSEPRNKRSTMNEYLTKSISEFSNGLLDFHLMEPNLMKREILEPACFLQYDANSFPNLNNKNLKSDLAEDMEENFYTIHNDMESEAPLVEEVTDIIVKSYGSIRPQFEEAQCDNSLDMCCDDGEDPYYSVPDDDETLQIDEDEEPINEIKPLLKTIKKKSILKTQLHFESSTSRNIPAKSKKVVSFETSNNVSSDKDSNRKRLDDTYVIMCNFENCTREFVWKVRYGKLRLLDHALYHHDKKCINCRSCEYSCKTIRQMRYHYRKSHKTVKMEGFGIKNILFEKDDLFEVWDKCYQAYSRIVGIVSPKRVCRRKKYEQAVLDISSNSDDDIT